MANQKVFDIVKEIKMIDSEVSLLESRLEALSPPADTQTEYDSLEKEIFDRLEERESLYAKLTIKE